MPSVSKKNIREMNLTSSFVAGGYSHHYHTGSLVAFFRFEGYPDEVDESISSPPFLKSGVRKTKSSYPNTEKVYDSAQNITGTLAFITASDITPTGASSLVTYVDDSPFVFQNYFPEKNREYGAKLCTSASMQVRSVYFRASGSNLDPNYGPNSFDDSGGFIRIQNNNLTKKVIDSVNSGNGYTICGWIKPTIDAGTSEFKTRKHYNRPILRIGSGTISGYENADVIQFGYSVSPRLVYPAGHPRSGSTYGVISESTHRKLYLRKIGRVATAWSTNLYYTQDQCITDNEWQHVAVVWPKQAPSQQNTGLAKFYVNGVQVRTAVSSSNSPTSLVPQYPTDIFYNSSYHVGSQIGGRAEILHGGDDPASSFIGMMDDLAVWTRPLSDDDIKAIWSSYRGAYDPKSGFLNNPPRVMIRENDNIGGTYPSYSRPGSFANKPFDDERMLSATPHAATAEIRFASVPPHKTKLILSDSGGRIGEFVFYSKKEADRPYELGAASGSIVFSNVNYAGGTNPGIIRLTDIAGGHHYIAIGEKTGDSLPGNGQALTGTLSAAQSAYVPDSIVKSERLFSLSRSTISSPNSTNPTAADKTSSCNIVARNLLEIINNNEEFSRYFYAKSRLSPANTNNVEVQIWHRSRGTNGNDKMIKVDSSSDVGESNSSFAVTMGGIAGAIAIQGFQGAFYPVDVSSAVVSATDPKIFSRSISKNTILAPIPKPFGLFEEKLLIDKVQDIRSKDPKKFERERKNTTNPRELTAKNVVAALSSVINSAKEIRISSKPDVGILYLEQEIPGTAGNTVIGVQKIRQSVSDGASNGKGYVEIGRLRRAGLKIEKQFSGGRTRKTLFPYRADSTKTRLIDSVHAAPYARTSIEVEDSGDPRQLDVTEGNYESRKFSPFDESNAQESFGISQVLKAPKTTQGLDSLRSSEIYGTNTKTDGTFLNYGTEDHIYFNEPLRSKDKIVIDLSPDVDTQLQFTGESQAGASDGVSDNFPMAYFNFAKKEWEKIGFGYTNLQGGVHKPVDQSADEGLDELLSNVYAGFGNGTDFFIIPSVETPEALTYLANATDGWKMLVRSSRPLRQELTPLTKKVDRTVSPSAERNGAVVFSNSGFMSPTDVFGFPHHPKYHATGSQTLAPSSLVDRPFLVEKIVYEFSGSSDFRMPAAPFHVQKQGPYNTARQNYATTGGTFFILNQRKSANTTKNQDDFFTKVRKASAAGISETDTRDFYDNYDARTSSAKYKIWNSGSQIPRRDQLSPGGPEVYIETVRDLVTFARVGAVQETYDDLIDILQPWSSHPSKYLDLAVEVDEGKTLQGEFTLAAPVKAPTRNELPQVWQCHPVSQSVDQQTLIFLGRNSSTRNGLDTLTGRSVGGEFFSTELTHRVLGGDHYREYWVGSAPTHTRPPIDIAELHILLDQGQEDAAVSPYIIMPGDELIFGWQAPLSSGSFVDGRPFKIHSGKGKLVLYGSYIKDEKPFHNPFRDPLATDSVHEQIPSSPENEDKFDTSPSFLLSGSYYARHVTGTMKWPFAELQGSGSNLGSNPTDNRPIGQWDLTFARRVVHTDQGPVDIDYANPEDGRAKRRRFSLLRGVKLIDPKEQYYDSMQPNPGKILTKGVSAVYDLAPYGSTLIIAEPWSKGYYALPQYEKTSNFKWMGSFPFEPQYSDIERVKRIDRRILDKEEKPGMTSGGVIGSEVPIDTIAIGWFNASGSYPGATGSYWIGSGMWTSFDPNLADPTMIGANGGFVISSPYDAQPGTFGSTMMSSERREQEYGYNPLLSRFLGCFGDGIFGVPQFRSLKAYSSGFHPLNYGNSFPYFRHMIYRGTKYGLINPTPLYSSAIFSQNSYGQFRDMIQQRKYSVFVNDAGDKSLSAVEVQFIDRTVIPDINGNITNNVTSGSATNSSNLSIFCTSSLPYDDSIADLKQIKDRSEPMPEVLLAALGVSSA